MTNSPTAGSSQRLDLLTCIRFAAAMLVVLYHARDNLLADSLQASLRWLQPVAAIGYTGVPFFFILSGFILAYTYLGRGEVQRDGWQPGAIRRFYLARFARIYPLYALALLLTAPLFFRGIDFQNTPARLSNAVAAMTLLQSWIPSFTLPWNGVGWSLSAEAFFYLLFPWIGCRVAGWTLPRCCLGIGGCLVVSALLTHSILWGDDRFPTGFVEGQRQTTWMMVGRYNPFTQLPEFVAGVLLGRIYLTGRLAGAAVRVWGISFLFLGVCLAGSVVVGAQRLPFLALHNYAFILPFGLIILAHALLSDPRRTLPGWGGAFVFLGEASYALYLTHPWSLVVYLKVMTRMLGHPPGGIGHFLVYSVLATSFASLIFLAVERPGRRWILRRLGREVPRQRTNPPA